MSVWVHPVLFGLGHSGGFLPRVAVSVFPINDSVGASCVVRTQTFGFRQNSSPQIKGQRYKCFVPCSLPQPPCCLITNTFSISFIVRMSRSLLDPGDHCTLQYIVTHVFCALQLPDGDDNSIRNDRSLAGAITSVMRLYGVHIDQANMAQWHSITRMMDNLQAIIRLESLDRPKTFSQLCSMNVGGMLSFRASAVS